MTSQCCYISGIPVRGEKLAFNRIRSCDSILTGGLAKPFCSFHSSAIGKRTSACKELPRDSVRKSKGPFVRPSLSSMFGRTISVESIGERASCVSAKAIETHCELVGDFGSKPDEHSRSGLEPVVKSAVIVGGGIGGLATAIALRRVGVDAQVFERALQVEDTTGTLIAIFPNGFKALHSIHPDLGNKLKERSNSISTNHIRQKDGSLITTNRSDEGNGLHAIRWSRIIDTLKEFLPSTCIHNGYTFEGELTQGTDDVQVTFRKNDDKITVKTPFVIGADGIRSNVRKCILGASNVDPRDNGRVIWRAIVPFTKVQKFDSIVSQMQTVMSVSDGRTVTISDPGEENIYFAFTCTDEAAERIMKENHPAERAQIIGPNIRSKSPDEAKEKILTLFYDFSGFIPVIEDLDAHSIIERRVIDLEDLPTWFSDDRRILLIGDSAHAIPPPLGQGANLALEDALELGKQIVQHGSLKDAIDEYVAIRRPRVADILGLNTAAVNSVYEKDKPPTQSLKDICSYERNSEPLYPLNIKEEQCTQHL